MSLTWRALYTRSLPCLALRLSLSFSSFSLSLLGTLPKRRVNLVLIHARDSKRVDNIEKREREKVRREASPWERER